MSGTERPSAKSKAAAKGLRRITLGTAIELAPGSPAVKTLELRPLVVADLDGVPASNITLGALFTLAARAAGIDAKHAKLAIGGLTAKDAAPLLAAIEEDLEGCSTDLEKPIDPSRSYVVRLKHPVPFGSETVEEISLAPLTTGHLWDAPASTEGISLYDACHLGGRQGGVSSVVVDGLRLEDAGHLAGAVAAFLSHFRATGGER